MPTYTFVPPEAKIVPPYAADTKGLQYLLFRYFQPTYRGVNVYILSDGNIAQDYPTPENQNTNFPQPYNPNDPGGPFAQVRNVDNTYTYTSLPVYIVNIYYGGHEYQITDTEAAWLSSKGYADRITVTP